MLWVLHEIRYVTVIIISLDLLIFMHSVMPVDILKI